MSETLELMDKIRTMTICDLDREMQVDEVVVKDIYKLKEYQNKPFDFAIDIGANVGMFSTCFNHYFPNAEIFAIEPFKDTYEMLTENVCRLGVLTINAPFGDGSPLKLTNPNKGHGGAQCWPDGDTTSLTLKDVFKKYKLDSSKRFMIKCDCEGGERYLLHRNNIGLVSKCSVFVAEFHRRHYAEQFGLLTQEEIDAIINRLSRTHKVEIQEYPGDEFMFYVFAEKLE